MYFEASTDHTHLYMVRLKHICLMASRTKPLLVFFFILILHIELQIPIKFQCYLTVDILICLYKYKVQMTSYQCIITNDSHLKNLKNLKLHIYECMYIQY
jgi:hypothetical protein